MVRYEDLGRSEEKTKMLISEEWVRYADWVLCELAKEKSQPKDQDGACGDSQREQPLTD